MDIISYILSKKYTDNTVDGLGGIKGAPCTVKSVVDIDGGKRITLEWESNSGVKQTQSFDIMDGEDGANVVEWSQIQQSGTKIAEININGVSTDVYAPTDGGGGSLDAVETTSIAYAQLPQTDKDDPTKIYFLNDTQPSVVDTPIDQSTFALKVESQYHMSVAVTDGKLVSVYNYGSSVGACAFEPNAISATASKIKFKLTTLGSYDTAQNHAITIGVKANYQSSDWIFPTDDDWLVKKVYDTRNTTVDDYIDISEITTPCYLMICFHGWTVTFDEFLVEDVSVLAGDTEIRYKDIPYGNNGGGSSWIDIQGTLLAGNTSVTLNNPSIKNTSNFEFFTDVFGVCPTNVSVSNGSITLTFDEQANDLGVKVRVTNTNAASPYTFKSYLGVGNTAGAYINTGLNIATTQEFEVKFQLTNTQADNVVYFGCWQSYKDTMIYYYSGGFGCGVGGTITPRHNFDTDIHVYKAMQDAIYLDDVQDGNANWTNVPTNVPYYLFKDPDHSGSINIRIYYAKIWDDGILVRNFIPAVRNDDGVIGMYDQVNDVFYTNDGTGSFITD